MLSMAVGCTPDLDLHRSEYANLLLRHNPVHISPQPSSGSLAGLVYWRKDRKGDPWRDGACQSSNVATSYVGGEYYSFYSVCILVLVNLQFVAEDTI